MNILLLSWRDPQHPRAGGAEQVVHEHAKGWLAAGNSVYLFSSRFKGSEPYQNLDGIHIIRMGYELFWVQFVAFFWYFFGSHPKFDLVIDQFHGIPFFTPLYIKVPKLALIQEVARQVWFINYLLWPLNIILGSIGYLLEPLIFLFYHKVPFMTGSLSTKSDLLKFGIPGSHITIISHGVILPHLEKLPDKESIFTIIFLGTLTRDKGIEDALHAFSLLAKTGKYQFWVVGKGDQAYAAYLNELAKKLDILSQIKFWGFVSEELKFLLLAKSHLLINPSVREGWGLVNIEANAMGTPVVAYPSPGLVDSVIPGKNGELTPTSTPQALANSIYKILSNHNSYQTLCQTSKIYSHSFSWPKSVHASLKLITQVAHANYF